MSTAIYILVVALVGAYSSWSRMTAHRSFIAFLSLAVAVWLLVEQVMRLMSLRNGPAGSVLAIFARPFTRKLL